MKKKSKLEKLTPIVLGTCMLTLVAACGNDDDDNGSGIGQQQEEIEGQYRVVLTPVNPEVAGNATGTGEFTVEGDELRATMNINGAPAAKHPQHIHIGSSCAGTDADTNGDGFVDSVEASTAQGGILIPLDSDLRSQSAGGNNFPSGATYNYNESTSLLAMLADLRLPDIDTSDDIVKLGVDEELDLEGKVVVVHGVPASTSLPGTVQGMDDMSPQESLPILCGVIERVQDTGTTTGETGTGTTTGETTTGTTGTGTTTGQTGTGTTTGETGTGTTTGETGTGTTTGETGTGTTTGETTTGTTGTGTTTGGTTTGM